MSELYDLATLLSAHLERQHEGDPIGLIRAKGEIATGVGFLVSMIGPKDPPEPNKIAALRSVATSLGVPL